MRIAIAGGTGTVGRHIVAAVERRGHEAVVLSRGTGVDVTTGAGLAEALAGVDAVIDALNVTTQSAKVAREYFETTTRQLTAAGARAGVGHHIVLSIVGIDGADAGYYAGKLAQERAARAQAAGDGGVPVTIARAGQFHEFAGQMLQRMKGPIALLPIMLTRPVAAREVGEHLVAIAERGPSDAHTGADRAADLVGPRDERLVDLARRQLRHDGVRRAVQEVPLPGAFGRCLASGDLRGVPGQRVEGVMTFDDWLDSSDRG